MGAKLRIFYDITKFFVLFVVNTFFYGVEHSTKSWNIVSEKVSKS